MNHTLPERLRLLRQEKKITQEVMAKAIMVPRVTYTHYELGKRTPDLDTILMIADFFDVSVDFLLGSTWLRPTLEKWLSGRSSDNTPDDFRYPAPSEPAGLKVADTSDKDRK